DYLEQDYGGETAPVHPLEILRDDVGFAALRERARGRLRGLRVACYYGCLLVRPAAEMAFDDPENPTIMEEFAAALGAEPVPFYHKTSCCGSYQVLNAYDVVLSRGREILAAAAAHGAQALITSCPLCQFNLDRLQGRGEGHVGPALPVLYFSQLLGTALDLPAEGLGFESHYVDPRPLLLG
ncbi:MAG: disulfide reductase, partial [Firmicutes bacterium]|nr:disulfide reductase [Bacillota bacterium]